jgi:hypothetical protein
MNDDATFDRAWDSGEAMTLKEISDYALQECQAAA